MTAGDAPTRSLARKLAEVMAEVGNVEKKGRNTHFNYRFVQESDLVDKIRPLLAARNVMFMVTVESIETVREVERRNGGFDYVERQKVVGRFIDGDSGEVFESSVFADGMDGQDKGPYKGLTGGVKYLLMKTFLVGTGDDPENDRGTEPPEAPAPGRLTATQRRDLQALVAKCKENGVDISDLKPAHDASDAATLIKTMRDRLEKKAEGAATKPGGGKA